MRGSKFSNKVRADIYNEAFDLLRKTKKKKVEIYKIVAKKHDCSPHTVYNICLQMRYMFYAHVRTLKKIQSYRQKYRTIG